MFTHVRAKYRSICINLDTILRHKRPMLLHRQRQARRGDLIPGNLGAKPLSQPLLAILVLFRSLE